MEYAIKEYDPIRVMMSRDTFDRLHWLIHTKWFHDMLINGGYTEDQYESMMISDIGQEVLLGKALDVWLELSDSRDDGLYDKFMAKFKMYQMEHERDVES